MVGKKLRNGVTMRAERKREMNNLKITICTTVSLIRA